MRLTIECDGVAHEVRVERSGAVYRVAVNGREYDVEVAEPEASSLSLLIDGRPHEMAIDDGPGGEYAVHLGRDTIRTAVINGREPSPVAAASAVGRHKTGAVPLIAPMPGKVVRVLVSVGDEVGERDGLVVVEAMKMENELKAPKRGRVKELLVQEGVSVEAGRVLAIVE